MTWMWKWNCFSLLHEVRECLLVHHSKMVQWLKAISFFLFSVLKSSVKIKTIMDHLHAGFEEGDVEVALRYVLGFCSCAFSRKRVSVSWRLSKIDFFMWLTGVGRFLLSFPSMLIEIGVSSSLLIAVSDGWLAWQQERVDRALLVILCYMDPVGRMPTNISTTEPPHHSIIALQNLQKCFSCNCWISPILEGTLQKADTMSTISVSSLCNFNGNVGITLRDKRESYKWHICM